MYMHPPSNTPKGSLPLSPSLPSHPIQIIKSSWSSYQKYHLLNPPRLSNIPSQDPPTYARHRNPCTKTPVCPTACAMASGVAPFCCAMLQSLWAARRVFRPVTCSRSWPTSEERSSFSREYQSTFCWRLESHCFLRWRHFRAAMAC